MWRETRRLNSIRCKVGISIHSLRVEGDDIMVVSKGVILYFNPLPPCGGRPVFVYGTFRLLLFQSTPSVWRETVLSMRCAISLVISIHSLRVEGDIQLVSCVKHHCHFNPLPPCGGRHPFALKTMVCFAFQSTPSVWRETNAAFACSTLSVSFQSTPSVWRETFGAAACNKLAP